MSKHITEFKVGDLVKENCGYKWYVTEGYGLRRKESGMELSYTETWGPWFTLVKPVDPLDHLTGFAKWKHEMEKKYDHVA